MCHAARRRARVSACENLSGGTGRLRHEDKSFRAQVCDSGPRDSAKPRCATAAISPKESGSSILKHQFRKSSRKNMTDQHSSTCHRIELKRNRPAAQNHSAHAKPRKRLAPHHEATASTSWRCAQTPACEAQQIVDVPRHRNRGGLIFSPKTCAARYRASQGTNSPTVTPRLLRGGRDRRRNCRHHKHQGQSPQR